MPKPTMSKPVIRAMAKRIWKFVHPRKPWIEQPDYGQLLEQEGYLLLARTLYIQVISDLVNTQEL